jgi:hypothetical protein
LPLEAKFVDILNAEPAVRVISEDITPVPLLDGEAAKCPVFTHQIVPTSNNEPYVVLKSYLGTPLIILLVISTLSQQQLQATMSIKVQIFSSTILLLEAKFP